MAKDFKNERNEVETESLSTGSELVQEMTNQWANLMFSYFPGSYLLRDAAIEGKAAFPSLPTLLSVNYVPTIGTCLEGDIDAVDQATAELFTYIRSKNSGRVNWTSANLMIYCLSKKSVYTFHALMVRALSIINYYSARDWNIPDEFLKAADWDLEDLQKHRNDLSAYINQFALAANTMNVPNVFPIIKEEAYLASSIFKLDESNDMGQYLMFQPDGLYRYEENVESGSIFGSLQWYAFPENMGYDDIVTYGNKLIRDIKNSEDHAIMSGDIARAFESSKLVKLNKVKPDVYIKPVYDKDILDALHNSDIVKMDTIGEIREDLLSGGIRQVLHADASVNTPRTTPILLDCVDWDPQPEKVSKDARWKTIYEMYSDSEGTPYATITANGAQILTQITMWYRFGGAADAFESVTFKQFSSIAARAAGVDALADTIKSWLIQNAFRTYFGNCLPLQYIQNFAESGEKQYLVGKPRCATIVEFKQLANMNKARFYMLFGVGSIE